MAPVVQGPLLETPVHRSKVHRDDPEKKRGLHDSAQKVGSFKS